MQRNLSSLLNKPEKFRGKFLYIVVFILLIIFIIHLNVDFKIRTNKTTFFHNCLLTGLIKNKYNDKSADEALIYFCRKAQELNNDKWIKQRGRIWE
jgi:hypothetical protein